MISKLLTDKDIKENFDYSGIVKLFLDGEVPSNINDDYITWLEPTSIPEQYITCYPEFEHKTYYFNIYSSNADKCRELANVLRKSIHKYGIVTSIQGLTKELDTKLYSMTLVVDYKKFN